jgi:hypothetical protein
MDKTRRTFIMLPFFAASSFFFNPLSALARDGDHPAYFLADERRVIEQYYHKVAKGKAKGLPPGLAKRGGNLPPGLQKQLQKNGQLPPGLQKRVEPLPVELSRQLPPLPEHWERVIVDRDVILLDRRTNRILDIIEAVIALVSGQ